MDFKDRIKQAVKTSQPLFGYITSDQQAAVKTLAKILMDVDKKTPTPPIIVWDLLNGASGYNNEGAAALTEALALKTMAGASPDPDAPKPKPLTQKATTNPITTLEIAQYFPDTTALLMYNAYNYLGDVTNKPDGAWAMAQGLMNLRDTNKKRARQVFLLSPDLGNLPPELRADVMIFDEPLPTSEDLTAIVQREVKSWNDSKKETQQIVADDALIGKAVDALRGIESASVANQTVAMSLRSRVLDIDELRFRKRQLVNTTPGLKVWTGTRETYADLEGYDEAKRFYRRVMEGRIQYRTIVFLDEIDKIFGNADGDSSGVTMEMMGQVLTEMEDRKYDGGILLGVSGAGKSALVKALAGEFNVEMIYQDISGAKGKYVGESTANLRKQFKIINAISDGSALFMATCNSITSIKAELRRRFTLGTFFFDIPSKEGRDRIWQLYKQRYEILDPTPVDDRWTGADIRNCVKLAWSLRIPLIEAAQYIVPVAVSDKDNVERLRLASSMKFLDANKPGLFQYTGATLTRRDDDGERKRRDDDDE